MKIGGNSPPIDNIGPQLKNSKSEPDLPSTENDFVDPSEVVLRFQRERGYSYLMITDQDEFESSDYDAYSNEVLERLARDGDMEAAMRLSRKISANEEDFPKAHALAVEASVNGFSASLVDLGHMMKLWGSVAEKRGNSEQAKRFNMESAAWYKTAVLRGDPTGRLHYDPDRQTGHNFTITELSEIDALAKQFYENLANERKKRNLPPFDNSYPMEMDLYVETVYQ
jgi:hypothetical protein